MDGSFPMKCYTLQLDSWFKNYEVFKISVQVGTCCTPLSMQQNLPKSAQNCPIYPYPCIPFSYIPLPPLTPLPLPPIEFKPNPSSTQIPP
jgi:hypothetical protein